MNPDDHDLLIRFRAEVTTTLARVLLDIKEIKDNLAERVDHLEAEKASKSDMANALAAHQLIHTDQENRLRTLEKMGYVMSAAAAIIAFIAGKVF